MSKQMPPEDSKKALEDAIKIIGEQYREVIYSAWRIGYSDGKIGLSVEALERREE